MDLKKEPDNINKKEPQADVLSKQIQENLKSIMEDDDMFLHLWEHIFKQTKNKIEHNDMEYIWEWKEWVVYKIEIELANKQKKIFLAVKKRFDNQLTEEIKLQKEFCKVAKKNNRWVEVPETLWEVKANNGNYFLMEYIDGKTLFNLKVEKIAESFYDKFEEKYPDFFAKIQGINKNIDEANINKASTFDFKNDKEARETMFKIVNFLNENNELMIQKYTGVKGIALLNTETYNKTIEKIYYDQTLYWPIFNEKDWRVVQQKIKEFLGDCHKEWLFHRDIWGNPSNIMFMQKKNGIVPVIIDFWQSKKSKQERTDKDYERWEWPYGDESETYIPDTDICETIKWLTKRPPRRGPGELYY